MADAGPGVAAPRSTRVLGSALATLLLATAHASPAAPDCTGEAMLAQDSQAEELVLQARIGRSRRVVGEALVAYRLDGTLYLPLQNIVLFLELPLPGPEALGAAGCAVPPDQALLPADSLESLLDLDFSLDEARQEALFTARDLFPVEERLRRERRWANARAAAAVEADDAPYRHSSYRWLEAPRAELSGALAQAPGNDDWDGRYTLNWAGDLAGAAGRFLVEHSEPAAGEGQTLLRGRLQRRLGRSGQAFGEPVLTVGEFPAFGDSLLSLGRQGRGLELSNDGAAEGRFDATTLTGILPIGWSVELLRDGELFASQQAPSDGQYRFEDVPLDYGTNRFVLNFFGPNGEHLRQNVVRSVSGALLRPGEWRYRLQVLQNDVALDGRPVVDPTGQRMLGDWLHTGLRVGILPWLVADSEYSRFRPADATMSQRDYATLQVTAGDSQRIALLGRVLFDVEHKAHAQHFVASMRAWGSRLSLSHTAFGDVRTERSAANPGEFRRHTSTARLARTVRVGPVSLNGSALASRQSFDSGRVIETAGTALGFGWSPWSLTHQLEFQRSGLSTSVENMSQGLSLRHTTGGTTLRADLRQSLQPDSRLDQASVGLDYRPPGSWTYQGRIQQAQAGGPLNYTVGASYRSGAFRLGADLYCRDDSECGTTANLVFGFGPDPDSGTLGGLEPGLLNRGIVRVEGFLDGDGDGSRGSDESSVESLRIRARGGRQLSTSAVALTGDRPAVVTLEDSDLGSPFLIARADRFRVLPRAGHTQVLEVPVVEAGEVEGLLKSGSRPLAGVRLQVVNDRGEVVAEGRAAFDGLVIIERVPVGEHSVVIHPEDLARLGYLAPEPIRIRLEQAGDIAQMGDIVLSYAPPTNSFAAN